MGSLSQSVIDLNDPPLKPTFPIDELQKESNELQKIIDKLRFGQHIEGGYFVETDRDPWRISSPFPQKFGDNSIPTTQADSRNASTSILYLLTPKSPLGAFHRNKARTVHTLHKGRGRYVIIHCDEPESVRWVKKARIETFVVGHDVLKGERLQWIVKGGKYKCSYLLPDGEGGSTSEGLLISETVVPGFEYCDHDFMRPERMKALVTREQAEEMDWMLRKAT